MILGIVGSRSIERNECESIILKCIETYNPTTICSGGARGVDSAAEQIANELNINTIIHYPDWSKGKGAGFKRNGLIVDSSDIIIAIYPDASAVGGASDTVWKAKYAGKPVHEFFLYRNQISLGF